MREGSTARRCFPRSGGEGRPDGAGICTGRDHDTVRGARVVFISNERLARLRKKTGYLDVAPELIVEVLSPSDSRAELEEKLREHIGCGVQLVWVVDLSARIVEAIRGATRRHLFEEGELLPGDEVLPDFNAPVAQLLED